jgi:hypothetical protein
LLFAYRAIVVEAIGLFFGSSNLALGCVPRNTFGIIPNKLGTNFVGVNDFVTIGTKKVFLGEGEHKKTNKKHKRNKFHFCYFKKRLTLNN